MFGQNKCRLNRLQTAFLPRAGCGSQSGVMLCKKTGQFGQTVQYGEMRCGAELFARMCAGGHADCRRPRVCRHMQVVRRIADDQCFFRIESQFAADSEYHFGRGFGGIFPRAGGGEPIAAGGGLADGVVQARPPFARGDGKPVSLCFELVQTGQGIGKERHIAVVGIEVMCGISACDVGNGGFRRHFEQVADDFGQAETFAKFLSLPTAETQTQVFVYFRPKYLLILPKYPLNPPRISDNQASGLPFRRQRAHLACWRLSTGSNTSPSGGFAHSL